MTDTRTKVQTYAFLVVYIAIAVMGCHLGGCFVGPL
jgi:hypothetical protein